MSPARVAALVASVFLTAAPCLGAISTLSTDADSYIDGGNQNHGTETFLRVRSTGNNRTTQNRARRNATPNDSDAATSAAAAAPCAVHSSQSTVHAPRTSWERRSAS